MFFLLIQVIPGVILVPLGVIPSCQFPPVAGDLEVGYTNAGKCAGLARGTLGMEHKHRLVWVVET